MYLKSNTLPLLVLLLLVGYGVHGHSFGMKITGGTYTQNTGMVNKTLISADSVNKTKAQSYGVVIDLGSKGSRVSVFIWPSDAKAAYTEVAFGTTNGNPWYSKITPGIATLQDPTMAGAYLKPLLDYATSMVPSPQLSATPIFIKGTDRLRQLNSTVADIMLSTIYTYTAKNYGFLIKQQYVSLLPGILEGGFLWVAVNYLKNNFASGKNSDCYGTLDMGSGSTQIAFIPKKGTFVPYDYAYQFTFLDTTYTPYVHSFTGYGYLAFLATINQDVAARDLPSPCLLSGYTASVLIANKVVQVAGSGSWAGCSSMVYGFLNKSNPCPYPSCGFDGAFQPALHGDFLAVSNYYDVASFLGLGKTATPEQLMNAGIHFCSLTWVQAQQQYPGVDPTDLASYCYGANYIYNLLANGYGFDQSASIDFGKTLDSGMPITWALGEMIYELQNGW